MSADSFSSETSIRSRRLLFLFPVWPEPYSTAAGTRALFFLDTIRDARAQDSVCVAACSSLNHEACVQLKVRYPAFRFESVAPNDPGFDSLIQEFQPDVVQYERFMIEEQFGWRVVANRTGVLQLLDTSDLHFLRRARAKGMLLRNSPECAELFSLTGAEKNDWLREMASILRVQHSFLVSDFEERLLQNIRGFPHSKASVLRWGVTPLKKTRPSFEERAGLVMIGNFRHPPNREAVHFFKSHLWPHLRREFPHLHVDIFGAYPSQEDQVLHDPQAGFFLKGHDLREGREILASYRALVAPLGFGAGIKGKILDAWAAGTPVITTELGAEGLRFALPEGAKAFAGVVCDRENPAAWCKGLGALTSQRDLWVRYQTMGDEVISKYFEPRLLQTQYLEVLDQLLAGQVSQSDFFQELLNAEERHSKRMLSRYIELKESLKEEP